MKNVPIITYDTSTKNISFIAGFDRTANVTELIQREAQQKKKFPLFSNQSIVAATFYIHTSINASTNSEHQQ